MLPRLLLTILLIVSASHAESTVGSGERKRPWPMPIDINLSSSFGEFRSGHLHAGVDIRTFGREGVPCKAVGDGHVVRLRASSTGYGKAVYLKLESGETVVYAHLAEFAPHLEALLENAQTRAGRYKVDIYYDEDPPAVRAGDVIGYSGSTGTSAPHLHFEVRDDRENPMNPLSLGWEIEDHDAPVFHEALWIPLSPDARIDGACEPLQTGFVKSGRNHFATSGVVSVRGRVGIGARIIDRLNASSGRLAPYRVEMTVNGVLLASITLESFSYGHAGEVALAYEMERARENKDYFLLLFRRPAETMWHRSFVNDGVIDAELLPTMVGEKRNRYTVVLRATDRAGNVSTASLELVIGESASEHRPRSDAYVFGDLLSLNTARLDLVRLSDRGISAVRRGTSNDLALSAGDLIESLDGVDRGAGKPHNGHGTVVHAIVPKGSTTPQRYVLPFRAGEAARLRLNDLGIEVAVAENSLYGDALITAGWPEEQLQRHDDDVFEWVTAPVELGPKSLPVRKRIEVRFFDLERPADERAAVYSFDEKKGEWSYNSSEVLGDTVVTWVREPGVYTTLIDIEPPRISKPVVKSLRSYATGHTRAELVIAVVDEGCGVDEESTLVSVDGTRRIARWDGNADALYVPLEEGERRGGVNVSITALDRVGNSAQLETRVNLRK